MSLQPGTRIPEPEQSISEFAKQVADEATQRAWARWFVEGLTLGAIAGGLVAMLCTALAWAHMGG